jgi:hypothetical protein
MGRLSKRPKLKSVRLLNKISGSEIASWINPKKGRGFEFCPKHVGVPHSIANARHKPCEGKRKTHIERTLLSAYDRGEGFLKQAGRRFVRRELVE